MKVSDFDAIDRAIAGQYIIKNLILISAALVVGGTVRQHADPEHLL